MSLTLIDMILESFFYVLLWICARRAWERGISVPRLLTGPKENIFDKVEYGASFDDIADAKKRATCTLMILRKS